jgi:hypothetical protein
MYCWKRISPSSVTTTSLPLPLFVIYMHISSEELEEEGGGEVEEVVAEVVLEEPLVVEVGIGGPLVVEVEG